MAKTNKENIKKIKGRKKLSPEKKAKIQQFLKELKRI